MTKDPMTMDFQSFHKYNRLVAKGKAQPLKCELGHFVIVRIGLDLETPVLWCPGCLSWTYPGEALWRRIKATIELYGDEGNN